MNEHSNHPEATDREASGPFGAAETPYSLTEELAVTRKRMSAMKIVLISCTAVLLVFGLGLGALLWMLVNHSVSNEQIRAQIEFQLTSFLGADHSAIIGDTQIALGDGGLLSIDASDVKILRDDTLSLGVAREVGVKVRSFPLVTGNVVAESITMRGASIAVDTIFSQRQEGELRPVWPRSVNLAAALHSLGQLTRDIADQVASAGLESLALEDTNLVGFDQFGLRARTARLESLMVQAIDGTTDENDLEFNAIVNTEYGDWNLQGRWLRAASGGGQLQFEAEGLTISDLVGPTASDELVAAFSHDVTLSFSAPFFSDGKPDIASARITVGEGAIPVGRGLRAHLQQAVLNMQLQPQQNQISFERSTLNFVGSQAVFGGGIRYPKSPDDPISAQPLFRFAVEEFDAFGLVEGPNPPKGKLEVEGFLNPLRQTIEADRIKLTTPNGTLSGDASIRLDDIKPHLKLDLGVDSMPVEEFKQFWPAILAPKARKWISQNMSGGQVRGAWVKADMPPDIIGQEKIYGPEHLSASISVSGTRVKNPEELPPVEAASGNIEIAGNLTNITVEKGTARLSEVGDLKIAKSTFKMGNFAIPNRQMVMNLNFSGPASAMVKLASLKPIKFKSRLKIEPTDIKGEASAEVEAHFKMGKKLSLADKSWKTKLQTKNVSSKKPVNGRKMEKANLTIVANPAEATIDGSAVMDGVPVKLALVEPLDGRAPSQGKLSLTLTDADRKKMGLDTGSVISGPITATVTTLNDGSQRVEADLKQTKLNFPWVGWSKGKGIGATASFVVKQKGGVQNFKDLKLRGEGFFADGSFVVDKAGLKAANLTNVKLNQVDDFDIVAKRGKQSYDIKINARAYDGRSLIRSLLNAKLKPSEENSNTISLTGKVDRLIGFGGQELRNVQLDFLQNGSAVSRVVVDAFAAGSAPTRFALGPVPGGIKTDISTSNAGAVLQFLDLYTKVRGGSFSANLVRDDSQVFRGRINGRNFVLLNEPRLAQLLQKPKAAESLANGDEVVQTIRRIKTDRARVDRLQARIEKGPGFFRISKGRLTGGDSSAAFEGTVYDQNNRMNIRGTFLPARMLNQMVSKIPLIGLAFGRGKVNGLVGITFLLSGRFDNPTLRVNPLSIIAPGVFRQIFKF